jgi:hypothetical protein
MPNNPPVIVLHDTTYVEYVANLEVGLTQIPRDHDFILFFPT